MKKVSWHRTACGLLLLGAATAITAPAQTFTLLHSFDYTDGSAPVAGLVQATNGSLYGTTASGGANGAGTVFKITPSGTLTTLLSFDGTDGDDAYAGVVQATDGNFYGTTYQGGASSACGFQGCGTIFKITPSGTLTTLYNFGSTDGGAPLGALVQANGSFYGTTSYGGTYGYGTVFKITPGGTLTTLHSFDDTDGYSPSAALVQAADGSFYGTTQYGNPNNTGTVFKITASGTFTTIYNFCSQPGCADGYYPSGGLIQATDGNFYGTTESGGTNGTNSAAGVVFKITPSGTLTTLYAFCLQTGCPDGANPVAGLVQATDGNFYGETSNGANGGEGTIFKITPTATLTTLHTFDPGFYPSATLVQDTNGRFYGTTVAGGATDNGTVFALSVGLGPFVETEPTAGMVGKPVKVLGTNLTGSTSVTFNGTAAVFTVVSPSLIKTTVPTGATTGTVQVTTPSRTLSSNVPFRVLP